MLKQLTDKIKELKFSDTVILLIFSLVVVAIGIVLLFPRQQANPESQILAPLQRLNEEVQSEEDFITAPVTPQQYLDATEGSIPPSGSLLRLWDARGDNDFESEPRRLEAIEEYPVPYPLESEEP